MEFRNLQSFLWVAELGSFTSAANELGYAQSTVTTHIQQLETELGVSLFEHVGRKVFLTIYGKQLIPYVHQILQIQEQITSMHQTDSSQVKGMLRIGLPAGIQGCIFNISNVLIQSSVNSFGSLVMAGNTAASNIEGFVYTSMNAVYQTSLSFTGQNMGARNYQRVDRILFMCLGVVAVVGIVLGGGAVLFGTPLLGIYTNDPQVIAYGLQRLHVVALTYFLCGIMDTLVGSLRGIGYSLMPMIVSLSGACLFRVFCRAQKGLCEERGRICTEHDTVTPTRTRIKTPCPFFAQASSNERG